MSTTAGKSKAEMTEEELRQLEEHEFNTGIIESYSLVLKHLTDIVIWCWKMLKKCGRKRQRPVKVRRPSRLTRIDSLARCFYVEILSYLC
ncbi:unnamed protein product [Rhizophagus irregularis]|nr:unnamed protein product [Rhizophagus irregularis]CAB5383427.1 unnamed protein product [Rhizophagus irregularis]